MFTVSEVHRILESAGSKSAEYRAEIFRSFENLPRQPDFIRIIILCRNFQNYTGNTVPFITGHIRNFVQDVRNDVPLDDPLLTARLAQGFKSSLAEDIENDNGIVHLHII